MRYKSALDKLKTLETELDNLRQQIVRPHEEFFYFQLVFDLTKRIALGIEADMCVSALHNIEAIGNKSVRAYVYNRNRLDPEKSFASQNVPPGATIWIEVWHNYTQPSNAEPPFIPIWDLEKMTNNIMDRVCDVEKQIERAQSRLKRYRSPTVIKHP